MVVTRGKSDFSEESSASAKVKKRREALRNRVWAFALMEQESPSKGTAADDTPCGSEGQDGSPRRWGWGADQGR